MTTMMEVNMPGCRWLTVHGYGEQSAFYAVAANVFEPSIYYQLDLMIRSWNGSRGTKPTNGTVVVRQVGRRWEVLAHFTDPKTTKIIIDELQKHSLIMLRTVEKLKEDLEKLPSPAPASLTATMEVLLAALKLAAVAEDKETTA
ncbi:hypothetical protein JADG_007470 [Aureobasidium aubasidani]|nr:hypothetical protein JADG_007470 [Aureobasidium pullulans]